VSMNALAGFDRRADPKPSSTAGCDMVLHCNGKNWDEMRDVVAAETPELTDEALARAKPGLLASRQAAGAAGRRQGGNGPELEALINRVRGRHGPRRFYRLKTRDGPPRSPTASPPLGRRCRGLRGPARTCC